MSERLILADVNVWLATVVEAHPHHQLTLDWWQSDVLTTDKVVMFCRITELGLLRLLCNETVMGPQRCTAKQAYSHYQQLLDQPLISFAHEPDGLEGQLITYCDLGRMSRNFWTDAYLAAFAVAGNMQMVTFDRGFQGFPELDLQLLSGT